MRKFTTALLLASIITAGVAAAPSIHAQTNQEPSGSMMGHGMMGDKNAKNGMMNMMQQMSQMMDQCSNMMSDNRPNDQWRNTPAEPEKKG